MAVRLFDFAAIKCCLTILNAFYITIALFLIGVVVATRTLSYFTNPPILVGLAVCASFLFLIAVVGLAGTVKHHQVILFFYMVFLGLSGVVLFGVSVGALALPDNFRERVFQTTWNNLNTADKTTIQETFNCCGFNNDSRYILSGQGPRECDRIGHPLCNTSYLMKNSRCCDHYNSSDISVVEVCYSSQNCTGVEQCLDCSPCYTAWRHAVSKTVWVAGSFGLIFSFTQIIGIVLSCRYRNLKDPNVDPRAFL